MRLLFAMLLLMAYPAAAFYTTDFNLDELPIIAGGEGILQPLNMFYFETVNDGQTCATNSFNGQESAPERNCKCRKFKGDTCLDIFVKSTAGKIGGLGAGYAYTDYCADNITLMEAFINGKFIDAIYYVAIDCPAAFHCIEGECVSDAGIDFGPSDKVVFDDEGNIISAERITVNEITLRKVRNMTMDSLRHNITSFYLDGDEYREGRNIQLLDGNAISADNVTISGFRVSNITNVRFTSPYTGSLVRYLEDGNLSKGNETGMFIFEDIPSRPDDGISILYADSPVGGGFTLQNPIDSSYLVFSMSNGSSLTVTLGDDGLSIKGKRLNLSIAGIGMMISVFGDNASIRIERRGSLMLYYLTDGTIQFSSSSYAERITTKRESRIELSYQLGIICADLSSDAEYAYLAGKRSFSVNNTYMPSYRLCLSKRAGQSHDRHDGIVDVTTGQGVLAGKILYSRMGTRAMERAYNSTSGKAEFHIEEPSLAKVFVAADDFASTYSSFFTVRDGKKRQLLVHDIPGQQIIGAYGSATCSASIIFSGDTLVQEGAGRLRAFGPGTAALKRFEGELG